MKRYTLLLAMFFAFGFSSLIFAENAPSFTNEGIAPIVEDEPSFTYGGFARFYGYYETIGTNLENQSAVARIRQYFTYQIGDVKTVVKFEMDPIIGAGASSIYFDWDADQKGVLEIKNAYLQFKIFQILTVKAGIFRVTSPGRLVYDNDIPGVDLGLKLGDIPINLIWIKNMEGNKALNYDDENFFSLQAGIPLGSITLTPGVIFEFSPGDDNASDPRDTDGIIQLAVKADLAPIFVNFAGAYGMGSTTLLGATINKSGYAVSFDAGIKLSPLTIKLFAIIMDGENTNTSNLEGLGNFTIFANKGFRPIYTSYFMYGGDYLFGNGISDMIANGAISAGLDVGLSVGALTANVVGAYHMTMNNTSKVFGTEMILNATYKLAGKLSLYFQFGVLWPGDFYANTDPNVALAFGPKLKW